MEMLPDGWLAELETGEEDPVLIDKMDSLGDLTPPQFAALFNKEYQQHTFTSSCYENGSSFMQEASQICNERPTKQLKSATTDSWNSDTNEHRSSFPESSSFTDGLCFGNSVGSTKPEERGVNQNKQVGKPTAKSSCTRDHVIAERKRREKLTQQFIALSAIIPGLKKMDKASVLGDCMKYVKHLQARVKTLEEQTSKRTMESAVFSKNFQDSSNTDGRLDDFSQEPLPEVGVRVSDKDVLIRIHCEKHKNVLAHILLAIEQLYLNVISSSVMPFGSSTLDITVVSQMEAEFNLTLKDLMKKLHSSIAQFTIKNLPQG